MKNKMRLSIIVPVYNVAECLQRCIDTLIRQNLSEDEYEVIIVNDGSTDGSLGLAKAIASEHSNINVISQPNAGLSAARNTGLRNSKGDYVWFVDSDDFVEPDSIRPLLEDAEKNNLDVQCFNLQFYFEDGHIEPYLIDSVKSGIIFKGADFISEVKMPPAAWVALYKRSFLDKWNLTFKEGILHEDQEFTPRAYFLAERIVLRNTVVINYFQREGSIMKSVNPKKSSSLLSVCDSLYDFRNKYVGKETVAHRVFDAKIAFAFSQALAHYTKGSGITLKDFRDKPYFPLVCNPRMSNKERLKVMLMNLSLPFYLFLSKRMI